jgi:hypothetical protein
MATQRAAVLNKNVLTQIQILVGLRTIAPQDLKALNAWIDVHGTEEQRKTLMDSLPALPVGDAWVWSPGWPTVDGIFQRVHVLPIETFDSGATPKPGEKRVEPKQLADIDLDAVRKQMATTLERAKESDPKELKKRISALERELAGTKRTKTAPVVDKQAIERAVRDATRQKDALIREFSKRLTSLLPIADRLAKLAMLGGDMETSIIVDIAPKNAPRSEPAPARIAASRVANAESNGDLGKGERAILAVLAQYPHGKTKRALGTLSGYSSSGGSFGTYLSRLRGKGYIDGSETIRISDVGLAALGDYEPLPRGEDLQRYWLERLGKGEAAILRVLLDRYPDALDRDDLGRLAGYEASVGSFGTYLSRLRTKELVDDRELRASEAFFE